MIRDVSATPRECAHLQQLLRASQAAEAAVSVAFTQFAAAHDLPEGTQLRIVQSEAVTVLVPDAGATD